MPRLNENTALATLAAAKRGRISEQLQDTAKQSPLRYSGYYSRGLPSAPVPLPTARFRGWTGPDTHHKKLILFHRFVTE